MAWKMMTPGLCIPYVLAVLTICSLSGLSAEQATFPSYSLEKSVKETTFIVIDAETTGLAPRKDYIIELAAVRVHNGQIKDRQSWLINPGISIPAASQRIHGISTEMVSNAPAFSIVYPKFIAFVQDGLLLSHNAKFDRGFMVAELNRHNLTTPDITLYDTLRLFKRCFPKRKSYSLENLARELCPLMIPPELADGPTSALPRDRQFHSALWDAECTAALFLKALETLPAPMLLSEFTHYGGKPLSLNPD